MNVRIMASADVDDNAEIGAGSSVWHLAQVREKAVLGRDCVIGRGAYIGTGVRAGDNCKVQNYALVYEPAVLEDGVFVGPAAVLTNDTFPRAVNPTAAPRARPTGTPSASRCARGVPWGPGRYAWLRSPWDDGLP